MVNGAIDDRAVIPQCNEMQRKARESSILVIDDCRFNRYSDYEITQFYNLLLLRKLHKRNTVIMEASLTNPVSRELLNSILCDYHMVRVY